MSPDPTSVGAGLTGPFADALRRRLYQDSVLAPADGDDEDRDAVRARVQAEQRFARIAKALQATPPRWRDAHLGAVPGVAAWCDEFMDGSRRGLLIVGPVGVGKTYQAWAAANALRTAVDAQGGPWDVHALPSVELLEQLRGQDGSGREALDRAMSAPVLFIDDLGGERPTDWTLERLYLVLNHRYDWQRATIVTTNLDPVKLAEVIGERCVSRLFEMTTRVGLTGDDRRKRPQP